MNLQNVYSVMKQLESESGKLAKQKILEDNKDNEDFKKALVFLLNPYIVTGISTKKMSKKIKQVDNFVFPTTFDALLFYLTANNSGRDIDILAIQTYIDKLETEELQDFVKKFVTKDLKLGISENTVNKVYGKNTIPSFAVMLAEPYSKKSDKITKDFYVTLKLDGNRCVAMNYPDGVKFYSRKGQPIEGMIELEEQFKSLPKNIVFDGEVLLINKENLPSDELFRATQKVIRKDGIKKDLEFHIFDNLSIEEFLNGVSKETYKERRVYLDNLPLHNEALTGRSMDESSPNIHVLPVLYSGNDKSVIPDLLEQVEKDGYEGLMINTASGLYQSKRTVDLQKVKTMQTVDLLVLNIEDAIDGQFKGLLGRVNVDYKGNSVGVGSGFTLAQRREFINNPELIVGKVIEVSFFEESSDEKTGLPSLRFPVFKCIRHDKGAEDVNFE